MRIKSVNAVEVSGLERKEMLVAFSSRGKLNYHKLLVK